MSISKSYFIEIFNGSIIKAPITLKELMLTKVAIQFCHSFELKKYILCMSESMYVYNIYCNFHNEFFIKEWEESIEKQSIIMCKNLLLPCELEPLLIARVRRIALQMLGWSKQWQKLLKVPRDFIDHLLLPSDWTTEARLNEIKVAERLVKDGRIDAHNRYKIACLHSLEPFMFSLHQEMQSVSRIPSNGATTVLELQVKKIYSLWSRYLRGRVVGVNEHRIFWHAILQKAVEAGQRTAVLYCWKKLSEYDKQLVIIKAAHFIVKRSYFRKLLDTTSSKVFRFMLPVFPVGHYEDILYFLLSQMNEKQRIEFFEEEFRCNEYILDCMLEWPYQELFVPIIAKLWDVLPKKMYGKALLKLAQKYIDRKENQECNYGNLLKELLEQTPESYKHYAFSIKCNDQGEAYSEGSELISILTKKQPFEYRDIDILQFILQILTPEEKQLIVYSKLGIKLCGSIILDGNLTLVNWIVIQCLPENLVVHFKKFFFLSEMGYHVSFCLLKDGKEDQMNVFLEWRSLSTEQISVCKSMLFFEKQFQSQYKNLIQVFQLDALERILEWCLPLRNDQKHYKNRLFRESGKEFCLSFLQEDKFEETVQFITWCLASEETAGSLASEESIELKKEILPELAKHLIYHLVNKCRWEDAELLYKWFCLSSEEIIRMLLEEDGSKRIRLILRSCSDEDTVLSFEAEIKQACEIAQMNESSLNNELIQHLDIFHKGSLNLGKKRKHSTEIVQEYESELGGNSQLQKRMRKGK